MLRKRERENTIRKYSCLVNFSNKHGWSENKKIHMAYSRVEEYSIQMSCA